MSHPELTPEQEVQAGQIEEVLLEQSREEIQKIARLLASKENKDLLGDTEFQVRDLLHQIGNRAVDVTLEARKKTDTTDAV